MNFHFFSASGLCQGPLPLCQKGELTLGIYLSYYGSCQKGDGCLRVFLEDLFGEVTPLIFLTANAPLLDHKSSGLQLPVNQQSVLYSNELEINKTLSFEDLTLKGTCCY